jgi:hypothetical protein
MNVASAQSEMGSHVTMVRASNTQVEILSFGHVYAVLHGENGQAVFDHYQALPRQRRNIFAEGILMGREVALRSAEVERLFVRDTADAASSNLEVFIQIGGQGFCQEFEPRRISDWLRIFTEALHRHFRPLDLTTASAQSDGELTEAEADVWCAAEREAMKTSNDPWAWEAAARTALRKYREDGARVEHQAMRTGGDEC